MIVKKLRKSFGLEFEPLEFFDSSTWKIKSLVLVVKIALASQNFKSIRIIETRHSRKKVL